MPGLFEWPEVLDIFMERRMAIALIVVGFLVTLVGGPSFVDHASKTQVTKFLQEEQSSQQGATLIPAPAVSARNGSSTS
jgi:hypothetical protein